MLGQLPNRIGKQSLSFKSFPSFISTASVVGPMEARGPLKEYFDHSYQDPYCGRQKWEKAELRLSRQACRLALNKAMLKEQDIDFLLGGDLLNQMVTTNFTASSLGIPYFGLFGACSTWVEGLILGSMMVETGYAQRVMTMATSHYNTAERQYRTPSEYGIQYPKYKQYTVTGSGAAVLGTDSSGVVLTCATVGKVIDFGCQDAMDLGAAMAPAAADTILQHFSDAQKGPEAYDIIVTGDLGKYGRSILLELLQEKGLDIAKKLADCGLMIYHSSQRVGAGGSGCGCSAVVFSAHFLRQLQKGSINRLLLVGTGALMNTTTVLQGENIPSIAHAVAVEKIEAGG